MAELQLNCRDKSLDLLAGPVVMGILNVTPDSFSDGGKFKDSNHAVDNALQMIADGAGIIDVGGESTRPGAKAVGTAEQIQRVMPVIEGICKQSDSVVSVDTQSSKVARVALDVGAVMVNDISALRADERMGDVIAQHKAAVVLMHMQGQPQSMQEKPRYLNVLQEVKSFLAEAVERAQRCGIDGASIIIDPGIGFGKTVNHNLILIRELSHFHDLQKPVLVGLSRKSFIGKVLEIAEPADRLTGSVVAHAWCVAGNVQILRVHDVKETVETIKMIRAIGAGRIKGGDS